VTHCRGVVDQVSGGIEHSGGQGKTVGPAPFFKKEWSRFPYFHLSAQRPDEKKCDEDHKLREPTRVMTEIADSGLFRSLPLP
jgi:hypothetical protein